ncbi:hypothetical protein CPB83DRAFT_872165 [Crepidotus variabilis]|uniref:Uncharacterized protein n=1 Tax=Crepidotus variabilis TaxID=179855 RepID=A0A9P6JHS6_9AGAR|nr:hypothetical protein CPB83DRAFT_872165 [Crepidotus variabilis]
MNEEHPEVDVDLFRDRRHMALVCMTWAVLIRKISEEYLVIYSNKQLKRLISRMKMDKNSKTEKFGSRTKRVDFKIVGNYNIHNAARLFRSTPNLMIYSNKNGPGDHPVRYTPHEVLKSLVSHCSQSLQRVDWAGPGEPPRFQDLSAFCNLLPKLKTLRLMAIYSYPHPFQGVPPTLRLPSLTTLSLGVIPVPLVYHDTYAVTWDPFLQYLSLSSEQLPLLKRFECDLFPQQANSINFFVVHGSKLRVLRTGTYYDNNMLPQAVSACLNLVDLVIVHGPEAIAFPRYHPTLERISLLPTVDVKVDFPSKFFKSVIINPLDDILRYTQIMVAPKLKEIRIRNTGGYNGLIDDKAWLLDWYQRWQLRGIAFVDQFGISYDRLDARTFSSADNCIF